MILFESFVNSERCKTVFCNIVCHTWFESFVNSERCKTPVTYQMWIDGFESFVNSERCKTMSIALFSIS